MSKSPSDTAAQKVFLDRFEEVEKADNAYTQAALTRHKAQGLELAVRARWITMAIVAVLITFINPHIEVLYYHLILALLALNGWFMRRVGRVGQSRVELALLFVDLALMTFGMVVPNPLSSSDMPLAMQYRFDNFMYFYLILAAGTLAYSWRTVWAIGTWTAAIWSIGLGLAWWFSEPVPGLTEAANQAFGATPRIAEFMDPNSFILGMRMQEVVVFALVAVTLGYSVRRFNALLINNAGLERERANLSRYFSPNVVEQLSNNDEPLKQIKTQDVAVLFIDIVGFTKFAATRDPEAVIEVLRGFHARMEAQVFQYGGTLDKYLGDGLMATFGTPFAGDHDAANALDCARAMARELEAWNVERRQAGEPEICAGIGLHFGSVVLGDIGAHRLEFAVIGNTVNISSRLEAMTRTLKVKIVMSDDARNQVIHEAGEGGASLEGFRRFADQDIRGSEAKLTVWCLS